MPNLPIQPHPKHFAPILTVDATCDYPEHARARRIDPKRELIFDFIEWLAEWRVRQPENVPLTIGAIQLQAPRLINDFFGLDVEALQREMISLQASESNSERQSVDRLTRKRKPLQIYWVQPGQGKDGKGKATLATHWRVLGLASNDARDIPL